MANDWQENAELKPPWKLDISHSGAGVPGTADRLKRLDGLIAAGITILSLALYVRTLLPTVGISDTAELQYVAATMGVAHPTGYPLYVFFGKLFTLLPFGNEAYRVNLLSAVFGAGAVGLVYVFARVISVRRAPAALGALAFAVSQDNWYWSTIAKMYTLHVFLVGLILLLAVLWSMGRSRLTVVLLVLGISFGNHRGLTLVLPALAVFWWVVQRPNLLDVLRLRAHRPEPRAILAFALPWLMYLYIPFHGIPGHEGFWETLNYGASGSALFAQIELMSRNPLQSAAEYFGQMLPLQFGILVIPAFVGLALLILGVPATGRGQARRVAILLIGGYIGILAFHLRVFGGDITGFLLPTHWILAIGLAVAAEAGLALLTAELSLSSWRWHRQTTAAFAIFGFFAVLWFGPHAVFESNFPVLDLSGHREHELRANTLLNGLEQNAVLVLNDDWLQIWQLKYQRYVAGIRPDTAVVEGGAEPILRAMLDQGRPAYSMDYVPTLAEEGRLVPVLSFWRALAQPLQYDVQESLNAVFDNRIRLTGWATPERTIVPGGLLPIVLRWEALDDINDDQVVFVHLVDDAGRSPAGWDGQPLGSERPTSEWKQGDRIDDPHGLLLPPYLAPGRYSVEVGLYPEGSTDRLTVAVNGGRVADRVLIGPLRVPIRPTQAPPRRSLDVKFGDTLSLIGVDLVDASPVGSLPLALYWRSDQATGLDLTMTVQILDATGKLVGQQDQQPVSGHYPTSIWEPGEVIMDSYRLPTGGLAKGSYRLIAAVYGPDGKRLPVGHGDFADVGTATIP